MKQTTLTQRLLSALVALCMVLSVCAPALAADDRVIWIQKNGGTVEPLNAGNIGTKLPGCRYAYDGTHCDHHNGGESGRGNGRRDACRRTQHGYCSGLHQ